MPQVARAALAAGPPTYGDITTAALLGSLSGAPIDGPVTLRGVVDNSAPGSVLEVKGATTLGQVNLNGGAVLGGTLQLASGTLRFNSDNAYGLVGVLDGVRVLGGFTVANGANLFPGYTAVLGLRGGVTFGGLSGAGRGAITVTNSGSELRALDAETLDHVDLRFDAPANRLAGQLLTTAAGAVLALGPDAGMDVRSLLTVGGGGTFRYAGAVAVQQGGTLAMAPGTTLAKAGGRLAIAAGGTLSLGWTGTAAPLAGLAGAAIDGTLALAGSLTSAAYAAALGGVAGAGGVSLGGTLDNTGAVLSLAGDTLAARLTLSGVLRGGCGHGRHADGRQRHGAGRHRPPRPGDPGRRARRLDRVSAARDVLPRRPVARRRVRRRAGRADAEPPVAAGGRHGAFGQRRAAALGRDAFGGGRVAFDARRRAGARRDRG